MLVGLAAYAVPASNWQTGLGLGLVTSLVRTVIGFWLATSWLLFVNENWRPARFAG